LKIEKEDHQFTNFKKLEGSNLYFLKMGPIYNFLKIYRDLFDNFEKYGDHLGNFEKI